MRNYFSLLLAIGVALGVNACDKKEAIKPPDTGINITATQVMRKDMPVVESAVGTQTSVSMAKALDPTRVSAGAATVRLPFPAHVARRLKIGQRVSLSSFDDAAATANGRIIDIRPALNTTTDSMDVIVEVSGDRAWNPRGSIRGEVILAVNKGALVVPEQAIAIRPAGAVVYSVENDTARAHTVVTGISRDGQVEILQGLKAGDTIAVDGASLLTDGARVSVRSADKNTPPGQTQP
jgi:membrane fusion protein, multidrug efflux system